MADTEEYFPRGGQKPVVHHFKQSSNFLGALEKSEKKKKRPKKKSEDDDGYLSDDVNKDLEQSTKNCGRGLCYKTVKPGVLILGRVSGIQETKVNMMLPGKMLGAVNACHISEAYNKLLKDYVDDKIDNVRELSTMFRPGQYVAVKVLELEKADHLMLSMMPQHVNEGKALADLHGGVILQAAVSSVEDHGYVMDIGIPYARAFLPKAQTNPELELDTGLLTWVAVKSVSDSVVTLSTHLDALQKAVLRKNTTPLLPGTQVQFVIDTPLDNGIEGHIFADTTSYVQRRHADSVKGKKPTLGQKVMARVLYVMPTRNSPFLTLRNIFETTYPDLEAEQKFKEGDIVEEAQVLKITGRCIHFKLNKKSVATMSMKRIKVDEDLSDEDVVAKSYPIGSTHRVRILCYHISDYIYNVSDQPAILNEKYFSMSQLTVGQLVEATVGDVTDRLVSLTVGRVAGNVPHIHLSDAGVFIDPKKANNSKLPKKKYKVGQRVKARVLVVEPAKRYLLLTLKPSLLAPDLEVLSSYDQALIGKAYTGVIRHIRPEYVLVTFFNNVTAYVPRSYVTKDEDVVLAEAFHLGQIVNCTILRVDVENGKMRGSLTTQPFWPQEKRTIKRKQQDASGIPNKKQRTDSESSDTNDKKKKVIKTSISETEDHLDIDSNKVKKKKGKKNENTDEKIEVDSKSEKKEDDKQKEVENVKKNKNKKDKESNKDKTTEHKKKKVDTDSGKEGSDESDAIETDIYDSDPTFAPQDLALMDLSDCETAKQHKRRVLSLLKAIELRSKRYDKLSTKIELLKAKVTEGKPRKNIYIKKLIEAVKVEKNVVKGRIKKLMEALHTVQEKLKEFGIDEKKYKKTKELRKERREQKERKESIQEDSDKEEKPLDEKTKKKLLKEIKIVESLEPALEVPSVKDFWSGNAEVMKKNVQEEESSSSEDEQEEQPKKKRKKLTVAEKVAKLREEEERVRDMERRAIESESQPRSSEQFERALLANPDSSQLWIAYMAFHLQATEIEKARTVGRKALNTINFREEQERLNVWLALLNCEHRFGTKESQQKTLEEALQTNDTFKVHSKLLDILVDTGKHQELSSLVDLMLRKYKREPQNYILCGSACFKSGMVDKARQVMQKAIAVLEKKEHVSILVQFALMERDQGATERAEALFEQILAVYPQRTDVCNVYADMLVKSGDADRVRQVMERMTSQKLPARKMKVLYKKWIEVEEKLGDELEVEKIKQRAMEFIDKAKF